MDIQMIRLALNVRRYHQQYTHEIDTVGKHSCGVALLVDMIYPESSKELLLRALTHDLGEVVLGDIPSPTKKALPQEVRSILDDIEDDALNRMGYSFDVDEGDFDSVLIKLADSLDGLAFCTEEFNRGNRGIVRVGDNYCRYVHGLLVSKVRGAPWEERGRSVAEDIINAWENRNVR